MQREPTTVDIDGHQVYTGATVRVKWLGVWYEGSVVKLGPKRNLCRVRDGQSRETVLLENKHLQFKDTRLMDKRITAGAHVVFNEGDSWREGVVESRAAVGVVMVSWRKSGLSEENLTWFELSHVAPVIQNELYEEHNRDMLEAGKSGLLHNDAIEPRPRTMDNLLYESGSDEEADILTELAASKRSKPHKHSVDPTREDSKHNFEEGDGGDKKRSVESAPLPIPPGPLPSYPLPPAPIFMPLPPMMPHPYGNMFLPLDHNRYVKLSSSFTSAPGSQQSAIPHPRSLKRPGLAQTSVPCIMSYTGSTNGIPPHPSSRFFQSLRDASLGKRRLRRQAKPRVKKSPTIQSRASSEPTHYAKIAELAGETKEVYKQDESKEREKVSERTPSQQPNLSRTLQPSNTACKPPPWKARASAKTGSGKEDVSQSVRPLLPPRKSKTLPLPPRSAASRQKSHHSPSDPDAEGGMMGRSPGGVVAEMGRSVQENEVEEEEEEEYSGRLTDHTSGQLDDGKNGAVGLELLSASPAYVAVPHGGSTLLSCVAMSPQTVHYQWLKDGKPISEHDPFFTQPAPGMLQIEMASLYLTGEYKCVVSDGLSSLERVFHLEVYSGDTLVSEEKVEGQAELHIEKVPPEYDAASVADTSQSSPLSKPPPIIIVEGPQTKPSATPTLLCSPPAVVTQQAGIVTPDMREDETLRKNVATEKEAAEGRRLAKRNRRRVSSTLKNDMEQYLGGYGENYGALSSQSNELEPWMEDLSGEEAERRRRRNRRKAKKRKKKEKSSSQGSSSPSKSTGSLKNTDSPKHSRKNVSFGKLPSSLLGKRVKKQKVDEAEKTPPLSPAWREETPPDPAVTPALLEDVPSDPAKALPTADQDREETNSVAVHTSVGASSGSEVSLGGNERERLELPREQESLNDSVRRLQLSVQEHCPEQLQLAEKERRKGFLSNFFPRNRS